ncbi:hypothetical protein QVD17_26825 [Tagetes erecta]|uniref:MADS-box domain-containing protein n=1 Tax=Tagetes erecta TaxID=13708 RepID=A0AAD8NR63_TARER|nr:hypothetical protein QVD17_26825 [Tagetes erecta]
MGRAKLRMELIAKEKTRNTTYHKRKQGIMKKANEFTILCDVDTVIIIYPPNSDTPEIWPENHEKVKRTIDCYKSKKGETGKRTYDLNDFFEDRKKKLEDDLVKARKKNMEAKYATWFDDLDGFTEPQLRQFAMGLETKENVVRAHLESKKRNMSVQLPMMFDFENRNHVMNNQHVGNIQYPGLGLGSSSDQVMMNQLHYDRGWFGADVGMGSFVGLKMEQLGYGYPVFDGGVTYDGANQWGFQVGPEVTSEFVREEDGIEVGNGVGDFVVDDHIGRFMS